jgi:outer membrane receptor protein involved in Fe transport
MQANLQRLGTTALLVISIAAASAAQEPGVTGTIAGQLFNANNGQPVANATVSVKGQPSASARTDSSGRYTIPIVPGSYRLVAKHANFLDTEIDGVEVKAGEVSDASTVMAIRGTTTTVDVVERASAAAATAEAMLTDRKLAPVVSDGLSTEDLRASTASDAAGALEKVTGVSIVDSGYVFVRGLGERYSATMLNNAMIPTTEPERRVVPLDLFPASLIDNIKVLKTYSADLPGEFSGGLVQMQTTEFPVQKTLSVSVSYGFNSMTTFDRFGSYPGGSRDWAGFEDGSRGLPPIIPADKRLFIGNFTADEFQRFGQAFPVNYEIQLIESMRPSHTYSIVGGNTFGRLGLVGAVTFSNTPQRYPEMRRFLVNSGRGQAQIFSDYPTFNVDSESVRLGAVLNAAYRLTASSRLVWRNTLTRDSDKEARFIEGVNGGNNNYIRDTRLRWVERGLLSTSLEGDHAVSGLGNSVFRWQFTYALSRRDEPDLRETIYGRDEGTSRFFYLNLPESGMRFFNELKDRIWEPQGDWSMPFFKGGLSGLVKLGFRATVRRRDFDGRRFRFFPVRAQTIDFSQRANQVLGAGNIRPDGFVLREITRATDAYDALMDVYGGYAMVDLALGPKWRVIGGLRVEDGNIRVNTIDPLVPGAQPSVANLVNRDPLPAVNVIYALTRRQNLRFGFGRTVNRPDFRELSPFEFTNVVGGYSTVGNPDLQRATIDNFDGRWEWFPGGNQVIAASYFYKRFTDPIEQIYRPTASELRQSFLNVDRANNQGMELEFRKNLGSFSAAMAPFSLQANFTLVDSDVTIPVDRFPQLTSRQRPLVGQSRTIYNVIFEFLKPRWRSNARFYLNSVSRRITDVGTFQLPDVYQERNVLLDLVYKLNLDETGRWTIRISAENLGDNHYRYTQADFLVRSFRIGRTYSIGTSYSFF